VSVASIPQTINMDLKTAFYINIKKQQVNYRIKQGLVWFVIDQQGIGSRIWSSFLDSVPHFFQFLKKRGFLLFSKDLKPESLHLS